MTVYIVSMVTVQSDKSGGVTSIDSVVTTATTSQSFDHLSSAYTDCHLLTFAHSTVLSVDCTKDFP